MNFYKYKDAFSKEMLRRGYSLNTIKNYESNLFIFFDLFKTKEHPLHINESNIKEYLGRFTEQNTQRSHHGAIKLFYKICIKQPNKFKYIPYCRKSKKLPIILSQTEIQKMFDMCVNTKHKVILTLLYASGLRVSELLNLKWEHIDRSRMIINIIQGKGKKDREIGLKQEIIPLLEQYYREYHPKEFILNGQNNILQYSASSVGNVIKQLADKAEITKRVYTHLIRHCCLSHMIEGGATIYDAQMVAGHANVHTTASVYCHISSNYISNIKSPIEEIRL